MSHTLILLYIVFNFNLYVSSATFEEGNSIRRNSAVNYLKQQNCTDLNTRLNL